MQRLLRKRIPRKAFVGTLVTGSAKLGFFIVHKRAWEKRKQLFSPFCYGSALDGRNFFLWVFEMPLISVFGPTSDRSCLWPRKNWMSSWRSYFLAKVERCQSQRFESHTRAGGDMMDGERKRFVFAASNRTEQSILRIEVAWMCAADAERRAPSSYDVTRLLLLFSFNVSKSQKQNANRRADNYRKTL